MHREMLADLLSFEASALAVRCRKLAGQQAEWLAKPEQQDRKRSRGG